MRAGENCLRAEAVALVSRKAKGQRRKWNARSGKIVCVPKRVAVEPKGERPKAKVGRAGGRNCLRAEEVFQVRTKWGFGTGGGVLRI
jgi:hypothetical protein